MLQTWGTTADDENLLQPYARGLPRVSGIVSHQDRTLLGKISLQDFCDVRRYRSYRGAQVDFCRMSLILSWMGCHSWRAVPVVRRGVGSIVVEALVWQACVSVSGPRR